MRAPQWRGLVWGGTLLKRIDADQVRPGMYIRKFDGSWFRHPFWWARFTVRTPETIERIRDSGVDVWIDTAKGTDLAEDAVPAAAGAPPSRAASAPPPPPQRERPDYLRQRAWMDAPRRSAARPHQFKPLAAPAAFGRADKARAEALAQRSTKVVKALFTDCLTGGGAAPGQILSVVDDIASTLEQNSSAFLTVTRLKSRNDSLYTHSVAVCAMMIGLARELGLPTVHVHALGTAGLLHDIGKVRIDDALLQKSEPLTDAELVELRQYPSHGFDMLAEEAGLPPVVRDVALYHQERLDGSGYPFACKGDDISQASRMAAICDTFETLTSSDGGKGLTASDAITQMYAMDQALDGAILFKFMRSIGVFPPRMVVRLRSNRLAIVMPSQGEDRRTIVRAFYSTTEARFIDYADAALSDSLSDDQAMSVEVPTRWFAGNWETMAAAICAGKPIPALTAGAAAAA